MRYKQLLSEQQLDELRMNPSTLKQFAKSPEANGIMAGFEAELVFTGLGGEPEYDEDPEPDMDADERCRSIQQVIDFFENDEYGYGLNSRQADKLREGLEEMYYEWMDEQMFQQWKDERDQIIKDRWLEEKPWAERIHAALVDGIDMSDEEADAIQELHNRRERGEIKGSEMSEEQLEMVSQYSEARSIAEDILDDDVEQTIDKQDGFYDEALDEFRDGFYIDDDSGFFSDAGLRYMSDVMEQFDLMWPVMTYTGSSSEGGFSEENARNLANDLSERLGVKTKVSGGYHSARRDAETWIFEPDSSLDADDSDNMPVEIVSPPMPLLDCLDKLQQFFEWAESNGAYSNESTGFHMGVSLPGKGGDVDYVKLALFLGDEYVLKEFGRISNTYAAAAIKKIQTRVKGNREAVAGALELMKHNLLELAQRTLQISNQGFGKYTSINPQGGTDNPDPTKRRGAKYIEFRSAGGSNYFEDIAKLQNTLMRYAQAMYIASRPDLERQEYYKKLYKLIAPKEGDPALDLFARFATGEISSEELKKSWADKALSNEPKGDWKLWDSTGKPVPGQEYNGYTKSDALERAKKKLSPGSSMEDFQRAYRLLPMRSATGDWEVYNNNTGETLETLHGFATKGEAADSVYDKYADQNIRFNIRPADPDAPEPELSRREKLAKRIKAPKPNWNVVYRPTGRVIDTIMNVSREEAQKLLVKVAQQHDFDSVDDLELHNEKDTPMRKWEIVDRMDNNRVLASFDGTEDDAEQIRQQWVERAGRGIDANIGKRTVPTDASRERYNDRQELEPVVDQPPEGMLMQRPTTGDYYEIRGGNDRVYGYLPTGAAGRDVVVQNAKRYVNELTGRDDAYIQYRAGDPVQATAENGVPIWELVDRMSGTVLHTITDHTPREATQEAMAWLRSYGAEDPATYSERFTVRPKMTA